MLHELSLHENLQQVSTHEALHFIQHEQGLIMHRNMASINTIRAYTHLGCQVAEPPETWQSKINRFSTHGLIMQDSSF